MTMKTPKHQEVPCAWSLILGPQALMKMHTASAAGTCKRPSFARAC